MEEFWKFFVFSLINFGIFLFILMKFAVPKILRAVEDARAKAMKIYEESLERLKNAEEKLKVARERREKAYERAEEIKRKYSEVAKLEAEKIISDAKKTAEKYLADVEKIISTRTDRAKAEIQKFIADISIEKVKEKIISNGADKFHQKLLQNALEKIEKMDEDKNK